MLTHAPDHVDEGRRAREPSALRHSFASRQSGVAETDTLVRK
jgi:hypothetical protein